MKICVYPGSFDPITCGHLDIIQRSCKMFDKVIIGVLNNSGKAPFFSVEQRIDFIKTATDGFANIEVDSFSGLLVKYAIEKGARFVVRGLRAISDFEYEFQMASMNNVLDDSLETVFFMTNTRYSFLSSSVVKEIASLGGSINGLVPESIVQAVTDALVASKR